MNRLIQRTVALIIGLVASAIVFAGLETATYIHELVSTNPIGASDLKAQGDDHIRLIKSTLLSTFANIDGPVTASHTELNVLDGMTASTAELNIIDGLLASTLELNKLDGLNTDTSELNLLDGLVASSSELNILDGVTATAADLNKTITITSGTYSAATFNGANVTSSGGGNAQYMRVGNTVTVSGELSVDPTSTATLTVVEVTVPIASNFTGSRQLAGSGVWGDCSNACDPVQIAASVANDRASFIFKPSTTPGLPLMYTFTYAIQ